MTIRVIIRTANTVIVIIYIGFLKTKNIGDAIILTASIAALPASYRFVDVVCLPHSEAIFKMNKRVRHIFVIPRDKTGLNKIFSYLNLFKRLFNERYDLLAHFSIEEEIHES